MEHFALLKYILKNFKKTPKRTYTQKTIVAKAKLVYELINKILLKTKKQELEKIKCSLITLKEEIFELLKPKLHLDISDE